MKAKPMSRQHTPARAVPSSATTTPASLVTRQASPLVFRPHSGVGSQQLPGLGVQDSPFKFYSPASHATPAAAKPVVRDDPQAATTSGQAPQEFVFKAPFPILKDTPRPASMLNRSFAPTTPSPLAGPVLMSSHSAPIWPAGRPKTSSLVHAASASLGLNEAAGPDTKDEAIQDSEMLQENINATPQKVRKSAISVAARRAIFENTTLDNTLPDTTQDREAPSGKRKYQDDDGKSVLHSDLPPERGFNWIDEGSRGKRVKLDKETIVKRRLEYFKVLRRPSHSKSLGVEIPQATHSPEFRKSTPSAHVEAPKIKLRGEGMASGRLPVTATPKKNGPASASLRQIDNDDEIDEMTYVRMTTPAKAESAKKEIEQEKESTGKKKTVTFK
ncbi:hypothetical protein HDU91_000257 [Kappamyces sp. JEL0680]|nr:hypothetical protein HDU91_000257 [Kappamyces sp. JEL0680]